MAAGSSWNSKLAILEWHAIIYVRSLKCLGKGSFWGRDQLVLQVISLNTLVDVITEPKERISG